MTVAELTPLHLYGLIMTANVLTVVLLIALARVWPTLRLFRQRVIFVLGAGALTLLPIWFGIQALNAA